VAKRGSKIQIETKKNHELFISNQAITDFKLANVRTAVIPDDDQAASAVNRMDVWIGVTD
jgi:hypothetical protein